MTNTLVGGGIALVTALSIFLLQWLKGNHDRKNHLIDRVYDRRLDAYEEINEVLVEIYELFSLVAFDFSQTVNYNQFDPSKQLKKYDQILEKNRLYLSDTLIEKCLNVFFNSINCVKHLSSIEIDGMIEESIMEYAQAVVSNVKDCMKTIRKDLKLDDIEKTIK